LLAGFVGWGGPFLVLEPGVEFELVVHEALDDEDFGVVLGGAAVDVVGAEGGVEGSGDEVLVVLLVGEAELDHLLAGEMVGEPCLSALGLAADPVAMMKP